MNTNELNTLLPIVNSQTAEGKIQTVNARDLYKFLESRQDFSTWAKKRIMDGNFTEGLDYLRLHEKMEANNATKIEYYVSLDVAKHIAMLERNEKGHEARKYFIECEKKLQQVLKPKEQCFLDILRSEDEVDRVLAIRKLDRTVIRPLEHKVEVQAKEIEVKAAVIENQSKTIQTQAKEITQAKPKVSYYDSILQSEDLMSITDIAKDYGISAVRLNKILESESVQYKRGKEWYLYHHYKTQGLTATTTHRVKQGYVKTTLKWNQKGRLFIHDLLKSLNIFATMDEEKIPSEPLSHKSFRYIYRNSKDTKPFEKWVEDYRKDLIPKKDYELGPITMPNSGVTMVDWILT